MIPQWRNLLQRNRITYVTMPAKPESSWAMAYIIGRLMSSQSSAVKAELEADIMAAVYRGYEVPDWIVEWVDEDATIDPEWVIQQLQELGPFLLHQTPYQPPE
jgi:hypothetical protein